MAKVLAFDLDGVLTVDPNVNHNDLVGSYVYARPNIEAKHLMDFAYENDWTVVIYTGRREEQRRLTENWLYAHGFHYHFLIMGKAYYTYLIDDRARTIGEMKEIISTNKDKVGIKNGQI